MASRRAPAVVPRHGDPDEREVWLQLRSMMAGLINRARIVLLAAEGGATHRETERPGFRRSNDLGSAARRRRAVPALCPRSALCT